MRDSSLIICKAMGRDFYNLSDLVKLRLERAGLAGAVREQAAVSIWAEVVGPATARVTRPEGVRHGILSVTCRDSMWAQQLHFLRPMIIEKLNERLGSNVIREIRISGKGFRKGEARQEEEPRPAKKRKAPKITAQDESTIEQAANSVEDERLAGKIKKALRASRALYRVMSDE